MFHSLLGKAFKLSTLSSDDGSELSFSKGENSDPCYACTQKGIPRFHSVSCEQNHPLFLEAEAGSSLYPLPRDVPLKTNVQKTCRRWVFGIVQDPRRRRIDSINCFFLHGHSPWHWIHSFSILYLLEKERHVSMWMGHLQF